MAENERPKNQPQGIKRNDPEPRPTDGVEPLVAVRGKDPNKHYVWVSEINDPMLNVGSYRAAGYTYTQYDPSEAQPILGNIYANQGDHIKNFGCVLMECSKEHKEKLDREGSDGMGLGRQWAEKIQATIRGREILDETEPLSPIERARMSGIRTGVRYANDDRKEWSF